MKGSRIRVKNMQSENESDRPAKFFMQNEAKNHEFFTYFSKTALGLIFNWIRSSWFVNPWPTVPHNNVKKKNRKKKQIQSDIIPVSNPLSDSSGLGQRVQRYDNLPTYPTCGPPWDKSNTWRGLSSQWNLWRSLAPWLPPAILTRRGGGGRGRGGRG